ncbi:hypothetical protein VA249_12270 [Vibrio alfacsensis]|uniref:RAMP superfamily CRISPR-associated protein n=1 Tax=Vibrio alfacsensis TaxID=1074311 RepID=UPI001BEED18E|nr:RAMP superfamily CRISPR-associated protein [Vibrio alfacsensis]BBM64581.1 hypothetical protein VA249_12270 [Vibrio alfacsensis]
MSQSFEKIKYTFTLVLESDLHIGDGTINLQCANKETTSNHNPIVIDHQGQPYIPASTLRGLFAETYRAINGQDTSIFGEMRQAKEKSDIKTKHQVSPNVPPSSVAGKLAVFDAILNKNVAKSETEQNTSTRYRTSIDPITQTAQKHQLFTQAVVLSGTQFNVELILSNATEQRQKAVNDIIKALQTNGLYIGAGKQSGFGKSKIHQVGYQTLSKSAYLEFYLGNKQDLEWQHSYKPIYSDNSSLPNREEFVFNVTPLSPILIHDPEQVRPAKENEKSDQKSSDLIYLKRQGANLLIPGTTLKGAFRAQARKILLTIAMRKLTNEKAQTFADTLVSEIFGNQDQRSLLRFPDVEVTTEHDDVKSHQYFNAIDRFTGGVKHGALFDAAIAIPKSFKVIVQGTLYKPEHKALWAWLVRDFLEGDIAIGYGKSKGYGALSALIHSPKNKKGFTWQSWYNHHKTETQSQLDALITLLDAESQNVALSPINKES